MELVSLAIAAAVLFASFLLQRVSGEREEATFLAIQLAKSGVRFPCRFLRDFCDCELDEHRRLRVREIAECELECVDCLRAARQVIYSQHRFEAWKKSTKQSRSRRSG